MVSVTSSPSATASLVTALGGGSGIDMAALASSLATAQFAARSDRLAARSETLERQISTASSLKSMLLGLSSSLGDRVRNGDLSPRPTIANPSVARAALSGARTPSGTFTLEVTALASAQTLASPAFASAASPVGAGALTLRFGSISGGVFDEDPAHAAVFVPIASGATLADAALAINAAGAGVTAYVANTGSGAKLVLKGQEGAANGFVVDAAEAPGEPGLAALAWAGGVDASRLLATSGDAAFRVDGLAMTSPRNTVSGAIPGLDLALIGLNPGAPTQVAFADPTPAITATMEDLATALNEVTAALGSATDPLTGELARDDGARLLKRSLAQLAGSVVMSGAAAGAPKTLADLGLATQRDGTFALDGKRLAATLKAEPQAAAAMFTNGIEGVFATIDALVRRTTAAATAGSLGGSINRFTRQKTQVGTDRAEIAEQQEALRTRLAMRLATADVRVGASKSTLSFLQNQIDAWNRND